MSKRATIVLLVTIIVTILTFLIKGFFQIEDNSTMPGLLGNYPNSGYYSFEPEKILESLAEGQISVFTPIMGSPNDLEIEYDGIAWTSLDFLQVADAVSRQVWQEPLDFESWDIYRIYFQTGCKNDPSGFDRFSIVYYKSVGVENLNRRYTTRLIDIFPWQGLIRWGGDAVFSAALLRGWNNIDLSEFKITAVDAMQIADENGGKEARMRVDDVCTIGVSMYQQDNEMWEVAYPQAYFRMSVNSNTGAYKVQYVDQ